MTDSLHFDPETVQQQVITSARRAIASAGGAKVCAERLNDLFPSGDTITQQAIYKWSDSGIPPKKVLFMERLQIRVDRYDMQPEVYGKRPE